MKTKLILAAILVPLTIHANLVDLTPGGFIPTQDGGGDPTAYSKVFDNVNLGNSFNSGFNLGPYNGLGGTYLFSNLFESGSTSFAQVSWNLTGQLDGDWLIYIRVFDTDGVNNIYKVEGDRIVSSQLYDVITNGVGDIAVIQFWGRNPAFPTPETGSGVELLSIGLVTLFINQRKWRK